MWTAVPLLVALATFATYTLLGNSLDVANALTALALFEILRFPLFMLPQVMNNLIEAAISLERVRDFLISQERIPVGEGSIEDIGIEIRGASFVYNGKMPKPENEFEGNDENELLMEELNESKWEIKLLKAQLKDAEEEILALSKEQSSMAAGSKIHGAINSTNNDFNNTLDPMNEAEESVSDLLALRRINFSCGRGELIAVVGQVASGKSTFINSILGEVKALSGTASVKGRLALFPQSPFIMNATLQNNVLFGRQDEPLDKGRYDKAISICALEHDIALLSDGDQTEIGEKGKDFV